eukprot:357497-Chlamydomonas_euryale.AAC.1
MSPAPTIPAMHAGWDILRLCGMPQRNIAGTFRMRACSGSLRFSAEKLCYPRARPGQGTSATSSATYRLHAQTGA